MSWNADSSDRLSKKILEGKKSFTSKLMKKSVELSENR